MVYFIMFHDSTRIISMLTDTGSYGSWLCDLYKRYYSHLQNIETGTQHNFVQNYYVEQIQIYIKAEKSLEKTIKLNADTNCLKILLEMKHTCT